jgi:hypothetical protein
LLARSLLKIKKKWPGPGARSGRRTRFPFANDLIRIFPREFFKKNGARQQLAPLAMAFFRSEALLVFTITNIFNVFVPASPAI